MKTENRSRTKRITVDILGVLCIIAAGLTGWLPGPGGIPLLILGLSLLATNHEWAENLLNNVKQKGMSIGDKIFRDSREAQIAIDIIGVLAIATAVYLFMEISGNIIYAAVLSLVVAAITLLLGNRKRYQRLKSRFKH
jgi:hypothetical protein